MKENFEHIGNQTLDYNLLKNQLLEDKISFEDVRVLLLNADQSTNTHAVADDNLIFLESEEIANIISKQSQELQKSYYKFLAFTQWHVAQNLMFDDKEIEGLDLFRKSLENSIRGESEKEWIAYVGGTIAYLENDINRLHQALAHENIFPKNKKILERMLARLEKGEEPDYKKDY